MAIILQTTFSGAISWMKYVWFSLKGYWNMIYMVSLMMSNGWFMWWLVTFKHKAITWNNVYEGSGIYAITRSQRTKSGWHLAMPFCDQFSWWRHQMGPFSALLALCVGNSPALVNSLHNGQWRGVLMFSLICVWINDWVNNHENWRFETPPWSLWRQCNGFLKVEYFTERLWLFQRIIIKYCTLCLS